jgi:hypothetical protein
MVLIARTASREDFSPQGLLENVLTPLVTHCQIWPLCTAGSCAWAAGGGTVSGSGTEVGTTAGAAATVATAGSVATAAALEAAGNDGEFGAAACALAAPSGDKLGAAVLPAEATVMTTATAATDSPPKTQGSKPVWFFMARLSSPDQASAAESTRINRELTRH